MKKNSVLLITGFSVLVLLVAWVAGSPAADKVGYINLQRLVNESKMGKAASADIRKMRAVKEAELNEKLKEINELKASLNNDGKDMAPTVRKNMIESLQRTYKDYQRLLADAKEDIAREDKELVAIILTKADGVLKKVAKKNKYTIILKDPNAIGYLDPGADITDLVLKELNKKK